MYVLFIFHTIDKLSSAENCIIAGFGVVLIILYLDCNPTPANRDATTITVRTKYFL